MANENIVTNIVATADFSGLIADINKATASLAGLQQQLNTSNKTLAVQAAKISSTFSETLRSTGQFSTHFVSLTSDVDRFGKNLDGGKLKLKQYFQTFQEHTKTTGGLIRQLAQQQVAMQNAILQPLGKNAQGLMQFNVQVPQGLDAVKNKTAIARQELQILNKVVQDGGVQLINWGKNTQWAGRQLTVGLTVPLAAFGKAAADAFAQADAELVRLTKVYGGLAQTSVKELGQVRADVSKTAKEIAGAYGVSFKETISLAADIAATGKTGNELLGSIKETSRLAVLGEIDRQDAMKATLAIQSGFKQNTDQLAESINFLNAVENQTSTTLADLVEAIPKAGPVIQGLGGSVKDLALYLTAMKEGGINAAEGANALKSSLASLINPTKVATEQFASFGIDLKGIVTKNAGNVTETLLELQSALDRLNPLQKQQALEQLFGKFQFARMNALFSNLGKQGSQTLQVLDLMKASSEDLANVAGRELKQVTESASGQYRRALEALKADLAGVGEQFLRVETFFIKLTDKIINFINKLPDPIQKVLTFVGGLTALAGPLIMLTGVLANFFGYIIKGVAHFKALFRGGEGWKLLTPEILAAEKAGSLMEKTMYSDAKAASILQLALKNLNTELGILQAKASSNAISVQGTMNAAMSGARQVNPQHPLISPEDTRSMSHLNPVGGMTESQRMGQTLFGVVPGAPLVNQKISNNPQMYMEGDLPKIQGLTSINGVSTGVVASEAAKWHAMTGAIAMQSEAEIKKLKAEVAATGLVTSELSVSYEALLPEMTKLTTLAAKESAAIVAELQAGKVTVDQARSKILALNANVEAMMGETAANVAASQGRNINLTKLPLVNQPVVNATGKTNLRELTRPGRTRELLNKIARNLGVKTYGAGYSTETTIPKRFATGGKLTGPGSGTSDSIPIMASNGEFIVKADAVNNETLPFLQALNETGSTKPFLSATMIHQGTEANQALAGNRPNVSLTGNYLANDMSSLHSRGLHPMAIFYDQALRLGYGDTPAKKLQLQQALRDAYAELQGSFSRKGDAPINNAYYEKVATSVAMKHLKTVSRFSKSIGRDVRLAEELLLMGHQRNDAGRGIQPGSLRTYGFDETRLPRHLVGTGSGFSGTANQSHFNLAQELYDSPPSNLYSGNLGRGNTISQVFNSQRGHIGAKLAPGKFNLLLNMLKSKVGRAPVTQSPESIALNNKWRRGYANGGLVRGYAGGGMVRSMLGGAAIQMGGSMLGSAIGGGLGQAVSMGSSMLGMGFGFSGMGGSERGAGMLSKLPASMTATIGPANKFEAALMRSSLSGTKFASVLGKIALSATRLNVAIGLGTGAIVLGTKLWKDHQEQLRINALGYGLTADSAAKAGLKYTDYNKKMKDAIENAKALRERNHLLYESMTQSGTPLKMTIEQYKKLKEQVKSTMGDYIKLFDQTKRKDVGDVATRLKAQFMAAGDSAETATAKIYTLIEQSNKAGVGAQAISSNAFSSIKTLGDAAVQTAKTFDSAMQMGDSKSQAQAMLTAFQAIDSAINDTVSSSEKAAEKNKKNAITVGEATKQQIDKINEGGKSHQKISAGVIKELGKQNPELAKVLNTTDTVTSAYAKQQLVIKGVSVDLRSMSGDAADAALNIANMISATTSSTLKSTTLKGSYAEYDRLQSKIKALITASKGQTVQQQIDTKARIKEINKEIDAINKAADAKLKALRKTSEAENTKIEIQKAQLDYQSAIARGDRDAAAQAQLTIQQLTNASQQKTAEDKIATNAEKQIAPLQKELDRLNSAQDALANKAALASESLGSLQQKAADLKGKIDAVNAAFSSILMNRFFDPTYAGSKREEEDKLAAGVAIKGAGGKVDVPKWKGIPYKVPTQADAVDKILTPIGDALKKGITAQQVVIYNQGKTAGGGTLNSSVKSSTTTDSRGNKTTTTTVNPMEMFQSGISTGIGTVFTDKNGKTWRVTGAASAATGFSIPVTKAAKGYSGQGNIAGRPIIVGDGGRPELFIPKTNGIIVPNLNSIPDLGPRFNIPSGQIKGMSGGGVNSSYNNNTYSINIELNGTNITPDDVMRKFKQELALINAKEGRSRTVGGRG